MLYKPFEPCLQNEASKPGIAYSPLPAFLCILGAWLFSGLASDLRIEIRRCRLCELQGYIWRIIILVVVTLRDHQRRQ